LTISGSGGIGNDNVKNMEMVGLARFLYEVYFAQKEFACYSVAPQIPNQQDIPYPYWPKGTQAGPILII